MATAKHAVKKLRSSDGRIGVKALSGAAALVAVLALLVGVLPVLASHPVSESGVEATPLDEGGGSGKCAVETGGLPSVAGNEFHINNPTPGTHTDGTIIVTVYESGQNGSPAEPAGRLFDFEVAETADVVVYDVIVNGGPKSNHYDYDAGSGEAVDGANQLHAPLKNAKSLHNLSHINICYDEPGLVFVACDVPESLEGEGLITDVTLNIFDNSLEDCTEKRASFTLEDDIVTLEFDGDGTDTIAGRMDLTKDFTADDTPSIPTDFEDLQYRRTVNDLFVDVAWCDIREKVDGDGDEFDDVLETDEYPSLVAVTDGGGDAISCKVYEGENAAGIQHTVVYFELVDPQWR